MNALLVQFLKGMLHPGSSQGEESFDGAVQLIGIVLAASWFLPASMYSRYLIVQSLPTPGPYRIAYSGDALLIAVIVSVVVALMTVITWPGMFLSRLEYLILTPLPISKSRIVMTKAVAASAFLCGFIVALTSCACLVIPGMASGPWETRPMALRVAGYAAMLYGTGVFTFLTLLSAQGIANAVLPPGFATRIVFLIRSFVLIAVVFAIPLIQYFPSQAAAAAEPHWLVDFPPAWFWACGKWIAGDHSRFVADLAFRAVCALPVAVLLAAMTYALSYVRSESVLSESAKQQHSIDVANWLERLCPLSATAGTLGFIVRTTIRSQQHVTSLMLSCGFGLALAAESLLYLFLHGNLHANSPAFVRALIGLPLTLSLFTALGVRRAFRIAAELPANWTFRFLETASVRVQQLDAGYWVLFASAGAPILVCTFLLVRFLGWISFEVLAFEITALWVLTEYLLRDWNSIPFTQAGTQSSENLIRRSVRHGVEFGFYSVVFPDLVASALQSIAGAVFVVLLLAALLAYFRRRRLSRWGKTPLDFEELAPPVVEPLELNTI